MQHPADSDLFQTITGLFDVRQWTFQTIYCTFRRQKGQSTMPGVDTIPRYFLYGEAPSEVELFFLHVEAIPARSGPHDWTIRAHAHPDHHQILLMSQGGGTLRLDENTLTFEAPALFVVPALAVHAIEFHPNSDGFVITVSTSFLRAAAEEDDD